MTAQTIYPFATEHDTGATCRLGKTFTEVDNSLFSGITGNLSPLHMDAQYSRANGMDERILFECLIAGLASSAAAELTGGKYRVEKMSMDVLTAPILGMTYHAEATMGAKTAGSCEVSARVVNPDTGETVATVEFRFRGF